MQSPSAGMGHTRNQEAPEEMVPFGVQHELGEIAGMQPDGRWNTRGI